MKKERKSYWEGNPAEVDAQSAYLLTGEREHIASVECWCKPYQDDQCPSVWIHNDLPTGHA